MELKGEFLFDAPQALVWEAFLDPRVLATVLPNAWSVKQISDNAYRGTMQFAVGSFTGIFVGNIILQDIQAPASYEASVDGTANIGVVRIKGKMNLENKEEQTLMHYAGDVAFGGRIASVSSRLIEPAVLSTISQSFQSLNEYFKKTHNRRSTQEVTSQE
jgi:carbon monoxide dehydrogenase subunit G